MSDIVERLRSSAACWDVSISTWTGPTSAAAIEREAADEIEGLRAIIRANGLTKGPCPEDRLAAAVERIAAQMEYRPRRTGPADY